MSAATSGNSNSINSNKKDTSAAKRRDSMLGSSGGGSHASTAQKRNQTTSKHLLHASSRLRPTAAAATNGANAPFSSSFPSSKQQEHHTLRTTSNVLSSRKAVAQRGSYLGTLLVLISFAAPLFLYAFFSARVMLSSAKKLKKSTEGVVKGESVAKTLQPATTSLGEYSSTHAESQTAGISDFCLSEFPPPFHAVDASAKVAVEPMFGSHRPDSDAIFAFAEGYDLGVYVLFLHSLRQTGFEGDVVLSVASKESMADGVHDYLQNAKGVVTYSLPWECHKKNGEKIERKSWHASTTNGGFSDCSVFGLYALSDGTAQPDPRQARPVATARYELYWIWSTHYHPSSRLLIVDVRDTYFQSHPFPDSKVPKLTESAARETGGVLRLFGENATATTIGKSSYNSNWIRVPYGTQAWNRVKDEPVMCSGSTMGDQVAVEAYLRALVRQYDATKCQRVGCDQGFHNYVHYFGLLQEHCSKTVSSTVVYPQGDGIVNNLAAMRNSPLKEQGVLRDDGVVVNWDGTPSPVVHQFDRDDDLKKLMKQRMRHLVSRLSQ